MSREFISIDRLYSLMNNLLSKDAYCVSEQSLAENLAVINVELENVKNDYNEMLHRAEQAVETMSEMEKEFSDVLTYITTVIDNMADGLLVTDRDGRITQFNSSLLNMFNIEGIEVIAKECKEVFNNDMAALVVKSMDNTKDAVTAEIILPDNCIGKAIATPIFIAGADDSSRNPSDKRTGTVIIIRDITAEKELDQMKTEFISTVSHELRTPLTSVLGFAEIITDRLEEQVFPNLKIVSPKVAKSVKVVRDNMNIILQEGMRLTALINDVLDIAKMEAGKVEWKNEDVNVAGLIDRALQSTKSLYAKKNLELIWDVDDGMPLVSGDHDRLLQVMINLISNAVKFTDSGTITCKAEMRETGENQNEIVVSVIDTGMGIDKENHEKVFEKFRQIGDTLVGKPKGTGLGLPICKQIIRHHGGRIWVESKPGEGSNFSFALPVPKWVIE
ncbi:MAG: PAS domain-containing protein [Nitrospirae bacterium]|nr:PAS domain-containing protein [Nitrospirota bacterium]